MDEAGGGSAGRLTKSRIRRRVTLGGEQRVAVGDGADSVEQLLGGRVLQEEPAGPGFQGREDVFVEVEGGEDEDPDPVGDGVGQQMRGGLDAVHHRHADVHEHDVRHVEAAGRDRLRAVARLGDDLHVLGGIDEDAESGSDQDLVVDDDDPDGHVLASEVCNLACTLKPCPCRPVNSCPSYSATRSPMPMSPWPAAAASGERSGSLIGGAGVGDLDQDTVGPVLDAQRRVGRPGVADDVGQGLLGDAVGREIDFGGQGPGRPVDVEAQVDPGQPDLFGQGGDVAQTGGRGQGRVRVVLVSQHFHQQPHLVQGLPGRGLDDGQGLPHLSRVLVHHHVGDPGPYRDDAHGMGDDVVQLAGDDQSLVDRRLSQLGRVPSFAFDLALGRMEEPAAPLAGGLPGEPAHADDRDGRDQRGQPVGGVPDAHSYADGRSRRGGGAPTTGSTRRNWLRCKRSRRCRWRSAGHRPGR